MDLIDIKNTLLKRQQICSKIIAICAVQVFSLVLISPVVLFSRIFSIHQEHLFSGTPESVCCSYLYIYIYIYYNVFFYSFYFFVSSKNKTPCTCFPANWVLLIVIDKFTIIEFAPFSLFTKGAFVTFGKICLCVKSHSSIFFLISCCPLSFKTERTIPLIFALVVATYFADQINLHLCSIY